MTSGFQRGEAGGQRHGWAAELARPGWRLGGGAGLPALPRSRCASQFGCRSLWKVATRFTWTGGFHRQVKTNRKVNKGVCLDQANFRLAQKSEQRKTAHPEWGSRFGFSLHFHSLSARRRPHLYVCLHSARLCR